MDDIGKQKDAKMTLAWSPETLAAFLAQPCYKDTAARSKLLEQPQEVVADLTRNLQESLKDHPASEKISAIVEKALSETDVVVHQNTADTWNIVIPSDALLELEDQLPTIQKNGVLQDEALEQISAGEIAVIAGTVGFATFFTPMAMAAIAAVGMAAVGATTGVAMGGAVAGKVLVQTVSNAQDDTLDRVAKKQG